MYFLNPYVSVGLQKKKFHTEGPPNYYLSWDKDKWSNGSLQPREYHLLSHLD